MNRFLLVCWSLLLAVGAAHAQGSKYTPLPAGDLDPEALKGLSAMLNGGNQSKLDPQQMELLKRFLKDTENDPERRQKMIDYYRKQVEENPKQFQNDFKQSNPNVSDDDLKKLMQNLGRPGDPPPQLPKPSERPPTVNPNDPPIKANPPKPAPNPNDPNPPKDPFGQPTGLKMQQLQPPQQQANTKPAANSAQVQGAVQMWENTVGPIDSTPAVKDTLQDLFGNGGPNEKPFWDTPDTPGGSSSSSSNSGFWKSLTGGSSSSGGSSSWSTPSWMKEIGKSSPSSPSGPKSSGFNAPSGPSIGGLGGAGGAGLGTVGTVFLFLIIAAVIGFLIWKFLPMIKELRNGKLQPLPGQGPWPVDPRAIHNREDLVLAFEYLSILVCGNGAVVWNHVTIAEALREALPHAEHLAGPLARLYAVARYTPLAEEIPESAYAEARHCLCQLAGVSNV